MRYTAFRCRANRRGAHWARADHRLATKWDLSTHLTVNA